MGIWVLCCLGIIVLLIIIATIIVVKKLKTDELAGSVVFVKRKWGLYKHYGVYIGHGQVIHFSGEEGHEIDASRAKIIQTSLQGFLKGGQLRIQSDIGRPEPLPKAEIVRRAKSQLEKCDYDLWKNNCEHFANWCRYGEKKSVRVDNAKKWLRRVIQVALGGTVAFAGKVVASKSSKTDHT